MSCRRHRKLKIQIFLRRKITPDDIQISVTETSCNVKRYVYQQELYRRPVYKQFNKLNFLKQKHDIPVSVVASPGQSRAKGST